MALKKLFKKGKDSEQEPPFKREEGASPHAAGAHDESNWLVSYADMMTLLCGFFIMMFSMAKMDEPQYEKVKESIAKQFGGEYKSPTAEMAKFVTQVLQEAGVAKDTVIESDPSGVSVVFQSTLFFSTLSADVNPGGKAILDKLITSISERQRLESKEYKIVIEGHTDSRPVLAGVFASNWELSGSRAASVVRMFLDKKFTPDHLIAIGYADTRPQFQSRSPAGAWDEQALAKNRRVVVRILEPRVEAIPIPKTEVKVYVPDSPIAASMPEANRIVAAASPGVAALPAVLASPLITVSPVAQSVLPPASALSVPALLTSPVPVATLGATLPASAPAAVASVLPLKLPVNQPSL